LRCHFVERIVSDRIARIYESFVFGSRDAEAEVESGLAHLFLVIALEVALNFRYVTLSVKAGVERAPVYTDLVIALKLHSGLETRKSRPSSEEF